MFFWILVDGNVLSNDVLQGSELCMIEWVSHEAILESGDKLKVQQSDIFRNHEVEWM